MGIGFVQQPVIVVVTMRSTKRHGYVPVKNGKQEWQGKQEGPAEGKDPVNLQVAAQVEKRPSEKDDERKAQSPVDQADPFKILFAEFGM